MNKEQENDCVLKSPFSDIILPTYNFEIPYQVEIPSREEWLSGKYIEKGDKRFYTDGSKTEHGTGFGIYGEFVVEKH